MEAKTTRYFFHIGYNGSRYNGWQKLPQAKSVQIVVETILSRVLKTAVTIVGCGRTDTRVHASQYFFHVDISGELIPELMFRLNKNLPSDIAVFDIIPMEGLPHARFDAIVRTYDYFIHHSKDPFLEGLSGPYTDGEFDLQKMKEATALLTHYNDYRKFFKTGSKPRTTFCNVTHARLCVDKSGNKMRFTISANRFLSGMVRIIVHKLLEVGTNNISVSQFENYLKGTETPANIKPVHPQGLYLTKVTYPYLDIPARSQFIQMVSDEANWREV